MHMISDFNIDIFFCNTVFLLKLLIARGKNLIDKCSSSSVLKTMVLFNFFMLSAVYDVGSGDDFLIK